MICTTMTFLATEAGFWCMTIFVMLYVYAAKVTFSAMVLRVASQGLGSQEDTRLVLHGEEMLRKDFFSRTALGYLTAKVLFMIFWPVIMGIAYAAHLFATGCTFFRKDEI